MKLIISQSQLKNITQKVILEQGAMDDILNNSPNAPTYGAGTPTANSGWWSSHQGLMGWINAFKDVYYPSKNNKDFGSVAVKSDNINLFFRDGRWYQYKNQNLNDALNGTNNFINSGRWNDNGNALELHANGESWSSSTGKWVKDKTGSNQKETINERQKSINETYCSVVGGKIKLPGSVWNEVGWDVYSKQYSIVESELKAAKDSCPNSELSKKMVKQDPNVNCASSLEKIKEGSIKILKYGCKNDAVKELQKLLGMEEKYQTGYFGPITKGKVTEFQKSNGLKVDGIVGPKTYTVLLQPETTPTDTSGLGVDDDIDQFNKQQMTQPKNVDENYDDDMFDDDHEDSFGKFDPDYFEDSDEGFSSKMYMKNLHKKIKKDPQGLSPLHISHTKKKDREIHRDSEGNEIKWSPVRSDEMPLHKYLEKKKMSNLDEDEDITMLDNLFTKD